MEWSIIVLNTHILFSTLADSTAAIWKILQLFCCSLRPLEEGECSEFFQDKHVNIKM